MKETGSGLLKFNFLLYLFKLTFKISKAAISYKTSFTTKYTQHNDRFFLEANLTRKQNVSCNTTERGGCQLGGSIHKVISGNNCQLDATDDFYCRSYCLLNVFRAPLCPSSGAREYYTGGCYLWYLVLSSTPYRQLENQSPKHVEQAIRSTIKIICCI
jgi:hypothetical protein